MTRSQSRLAPPYLYVIWATVIVVTLIPVFSSLIPPGGDYSAHIARVHVLNSLGTDVNLQRFYQSDWSVMPNLAFDLITLPLMKVMGPYAAGRTFVVLCIVAHFAAVAILRKQIVGHVGYLPLLMALFIYSAPATYGLANFYLGQVFLLFALSIWLVTQNWQWHSRLLVMTGVTTVLFFSHLIIVGVYGFIVGLMWLREIHTKRRFNQHRDIAFIGQFAAPIVLWVFVHTPSPGTEFQFGPLMARMRALASPILSYQYFDFILAGVLIVLFIGLLMSRRLRIAPAFQFPIAALALISLFMPEAIFGIWLVNIRLPILVVMLLLATLNVDIKDRGLRTILLGALLIFTALKLYKVETVTLACDAKQRQFISALAPLQPNSRILPVMNQLESYDCLYPVYWHMPALAVIEKSVFNPLMTTSVWPLDLKPEFKGLAQLKPRPVSPQVLFGNLDTFGEKEWNKKIAENWRQNFDYLIWMHPNSRPTNLPHHLKVISSGAFFTIYQIQKSAR